MSGKEQESSTKNKALVEEKEIASSEKHALLLNEVSISVSFTGIMSAATFFSIPVLITSYRSNLFVALLYLFISMFGYVYSTIIYANASGHLARLNRREGEKIISAGNTISEFMGVYFTVFALPIIFLTFTSVTLAALIFAAGMVGFVYYHLAGFSILERYVRSKSFFALLILTAVFMTLNFAAIVIFGGDIMQTVTLVSTGALIFYTLSLAGYCLRRKES